MPSLFNFVMETMKRKWVWKVSCDMRFSFISAKSLYCCRHNCWNQFWQFLVFPSKKLIATVPWKLRVKVWDEVVASSPKAQHSVTKWKQKKWKIHLSMLCIKLRMLKGSTLQEWNWKKINQGQHVQYKMH